MSLVTAALFALLVTVFFADAARGLFAGEDAVPWRETVVEISSSPSGAQVEISDTPRGTTPYRGIEYCRGRRISVVVRAKGYRVWVYNGMCPTDGPLQLAPRLSLQQTLAD